MDLVNLNLIFLNLNLIFKTLILGGTKTTWRTNFDRTAAVTFKYNGETKILAVGQTYDWFILFIF
jgi:hypothetical protein